MTTDNQDDTGVVFRKTTGHYTVHSNGRELDCRLSSLLHKQLATSTAARGATSLRTRVHAVREGSASRRARAWSAARPSLAGRLRSRSTK
jgi:hypothetical protein